MKTVALLSLFLAAFLSGSAHNWQTIQRLDTNYYNGGAIIPNYPVIDTHLLRVMWVDSSGISGNDSVFYFYRTIRIDTPYYTSSKCRDTAAASWLGPKMIRQAGGSELYFNMRGDTITINTNAALGTSWTLVKDAAGIIYQGKVSAVSIAGIDGVLDSIKTISIQAMNGSTPIADPYNSLVLQFSKDHGWIKTLDLHRFPYKTDLGVFNILGIMRDSLQHQRLPKRFSTCFQKNIDLVKRYAPGSEWISVYSYGRSPSGNVDTVLTYDSVISANLLSPNWIAVTMLTKKDSSVRSTWIPYFSSSTFTHTDTISAAPAGPPYYPFSLMDAKTGPIQNTGVGWPFARYRSRYFVDTVSNGNFSIERIEDEDGWDLVRTRACWQIKATSPDRYGMASGYVEDFGSRLEIFYAETGGIAHTYYRAEVIYATVSGMNWGQKMRLTKLGIDDKLQIPSFSIHPNPANDFLTVTSSLPAQVFQLSMTDVTGQECYRQSFSGNTFVVPSKDMMSGMYFLDLSTKNGRQTFKVIVHH